MSIESMKEDVVYIEDPQKSKEIKNALNSDDKAFADVKPYVPTYNELYEHWLKTKDKSKKKRKPEQLPGQIDLFDIIDVEVKINGND